MPPVARRRALRCGASALAVGLAGCSALGRRSDDGVRIVELEVVNHNLCPHTVHALLLGEGEGDEEVAYWSSLRATAADEDANRAGGGTFTDLPGEPGAYTLYARATNQTDERWTSATVHEYDAACVGLRIMLGTLHHERPDDVSIWHHTDCESNPTDG